MTRARFQRVVLVRGSGLLGAAAVRRHLDLVVDQPLLLLREPDNPRDRDAVQVLDLLGRAVGYVQRPDCTAVAIRLDAGELLLAAVRRAPERVGTRRFRVAHARIWSEGSAGVATRRALSRPRLGVDA